MVWLNTENRQQSSPQVHSSVQIKIKDVFDRRRKYLQDLLR